MSNQKSSTVVSLDRYRKESDRKAYDRAAILQAGKLVDLLASPDTSEDTREAIMLALSEMSIMLDIPLPQIGATIRARSKARIEYAKILCAAQRVWKMNHDDVDDELPRIDQLIAFTKDSLNHYMTPTRFEGDNAYLRREVEKYRTERLLIEEFGEVAVTKAEDAARKRIFDALENVLSVVAVELRGGQRLRAV
jgi:hypothetical protein